MMKHRLFRSLIDLLLRPFGKKVLPSYIGRWHSHNGSISRTLYQIGWRVGGIHEKTEQSGLDLFIRDHYRKPK